MTMTLVKLRYNSKLVPDPGLVLQTPLCTVGQYMKMKCHTLIPNYSKFYVFMASMDYQRSKVP